MSATTLFADTTVAEALALLPAAGRVLTARHTACVGCYLARFCTLRDTADFYNIPLDALITQLRSTNSDFLVSSGGTNA